MKTLGRPETEVTLLYLGIAVPKLVYHHVTADVKYLFSSAYLHIGYNFFMGDYFHMMSLVQLWIPVLDITCYSQIKYQSLY